MTFSEFLHWLEGFKEGINKAPTDAQWKKIQEKLNEIKKDEKPNNPFPINVPHKTKQYDYYQPAWIYRPYAIDISIPHTGTFICTSNTSSETTFVNPIKWDGKETNQLNCISF